MSGLVWRRALARFRAGRPSSERAAGVAFDAAPTHEDLDFAAAERLADRLWPPRRLRKLAACASLAAGRRVSALKKGRAMWASAKKWAKWSLMACGGLFVLLTCSVALRPSTPSADATAPSSPQVSAPAKADAKADERIAAQRKALAEQTDVIDQARQACSVRVGVLGEALAAGDTVRAIGLARNARSACDEGRAAIYQLSPPKGLSKDLRELWSTVLEDCKFALSRAGDVAQAGEKLAEDMTSPTAIHELTEAAKTSRQADESCAQQGGARLSVFEPTPSPTPTAN